MLAALLRTMVEDIVNSAWMPNTSLPKWTPHSLWLGCSKFISVNNKWTVDEFPSMGVSAHQAVNPTGLADNMKMNQGVLGRIFVPDLCNTLLMAFWCFSGNATHIASFHRFVPFFKKIPLLCWSWARQQLFMQGGPVCGFEGAQQLPMSTMCGSRLLQNNHDIIHHDELATLLRCPTRLNLHFGHPPHPKNN